MRSCALVALIGCSTLLVGCYDDIAVDEYCPPLETGCESYDYDGDGVANANDDFPEDADCSVRDDTNCSACGTGCGQNQTCTAEGTCLCINAWTGESCDVCPANWTGDACDTCSFNWTGEACDVCPANWTGDACDTCIVGWTGENCDTCASNWTGDDCKACVSPYFGSECQLCTSAPGVACQRPVEVDVLLVVDTSSSAGSEQWAFATELPTFLAHLDPDGSLDVRFASVTMDMSCEPRNTQVTASMGNFSKTSATGYPLAVGLKVPWPCGTDSDCAGLDCSLFDTSCEAPEQGGQWRCQSAQSATCATNPNGSLNSRCTRRCTTDEECQTLLGESGHCWKAAGSPSDWLCMRSPPVCPETIPPVVTDAQLDLLPCVASVGINQSKCLDTEQGFAAALAAFDPLGGNAAHFTCTAEDEEIGACQAFLRPDAALVVVFLSDEDDCSLGAGVEPLGQDDQDRCALLGDTTSGGPLLPVDAFTASLQARKGSASAVFVAAVVAGAVPGQQPDDALLSAECLAIKAEHEALVAAGEMSAEEADIATQEQCYLLSFVPNTYSCYRATAICNASLGQGYWGARYAEMVASFGPRGVLANTCAPDGMSATLASVGASLNGLLVNGVSDD